MKKFWKIARSVLIVLAALLVFTFVWIVANEYVPLANE